MPCKKKKQPACTSTPRRVLESLSIKDVAQARANCFPNSLSSRKGSLSSRKGSQSSWKDSVSPSMSGQYVSDRDDCNLDVYRSSHHQRPKSSGSRPQSRKHSKTCVPLCAKVSAVFDEIQHCRDVIEALAQEAQSVISTASGLLLGDCVCNKSDQTKNKHNANRKKVKKVNSNSSCRKIFGKKGSNSDTCCVSSSWMDDCVCGEAETQSRNKANKGSTVESKEFCQKICGKKSSIKNTASDGSCDEKKKKQNKKVTTVDSKICCQKKSGDKDRSRVCISHKDLGYSSSEEDVKNQNKKIKKECSCQKKIEKNTSDKNTSYAPPIVADDCGCDKEMKKRSKKLKKTDNKDSSQKIDGKKSGDKDTCCIPPISVDNNCTCEEKKKQNKKLKNTDCENNCPKMFEKKNSDKNTYCIPPVDNDDCACDPEMNKKCCQKTFRKKNTSCVPIAPEDLDNCVSENDMKKRNKLETDSKNRCQKVCRKKTSDKDTSCVKPIVFDDWICEVAEKKRQKSKENKLDSVANACGIPSCADNTCKCRFPPAFSQHYYCTGQISGNCQCDKEKN